jgi:hypothetical protein
VRNQCGAAPEQKMTTSGFDDRISVDRKSVAGHYRRAGKTSGPLGRRIKNAALKHVDRTPPINQNDSGGTDPTRSSRSADLAFQHAMRCAIAQGLERPPMIGLVKDTRPLNAPRLFEPVPHSSGCTSPALECAELVAHDDWPAAPKFRPR